MGLKDKIWNRLVGYFGNEANNYEFYHLGSNLYVYPKSYGIEPMLDEPFQYAILVVEEDGEIRKDSEKIFNGYATITP